MTALYTMALLTNAPQELWPQALESVASEAEEAFGPRFVIVSFDPKSSPPRHAGRPSRDDPMSRYADRASPAKTPYLSSREAVAFFQDASKPKYIELTNEKTLILLVSPQDVAAVSPNIDSLCLFVMKAQASVPFAYEVIHAIPAGTSAPAARMAIVGEAKIEVAAAFFAEAEREMKELGEDRVDLSFAGCIDFDRDQLDLAASFDKPFLEAFPASPARGHAKYIAKRLMTRDLSSPTVDPAERLGALAKLAESLG